jgi:hypothetical protein
MKKVFILTGSQAYAPSNASASANTGITPDILASGAIGLYGIAEKSAVAAAVGQSLLLSESAGASSASLFDTDEIAAGTGDVEMFELVQGAVTTPIRTGWIQRRGVSRITKQAFVAPVKEVSFVGYNGTSGSLNLPTITQNSDGTILAVMAEESAPDRIREQETYTSDPYAASTSAYDVISNIVTKINTAISKTHTAFVVSNGSQADFTGTATGLLFTKGSRTVSFVIQDATSGWVASTGSVTAADVIGVAHSNMKSVTFTCTANATKVSIGGTIYVVADAGTNAQNAAAVAAAINAGTLATATVSGTADVTVVLKPEVYGAKILAFDDNGAGSYTTLTLTVNATTGETVGTIHKAAATVSAAASFELDRPYRGETGYYLGGTSMTLNAGIVTSITEQGIKLVVDRAGIVYYHSRQGVLENATITQTVGSSLGFGTGADVVKIEEGLIAYRGQFDTVDRRMKQLPRFANAATNYDAYTIQFTNSTFASGWSKSDNSSIIVFSPIGNTGAANFEGTLKDLCPQAICNF